MKSIKLIVAATMVTTGFGLFLGATDAHAESLYTVKQGDSLSTIAKQFNGDQRLVEKIAKENNISNANMIFVGEELVIRNLDEQGSTASATPTTPVTTEPVVQEATTQAVEAPVASQAPVSADSSSAKEWIAQRESSGSYDATNGRYIGRYQLDSSYLNGDYSPANQERVADEYVTGRYGSWEAAQAFWLANGWY